MDLPRVKIFTTVPADHGDVIRDALGKAGAGQIGEYSFCSFSITGKGRSIPSEKAKPYIGEANELEVIDEEQVEVVCNRAIARQVIAALRVVHPYEEPIVDVVPLISESEL